MSWEELATLIALGLGSGVGLSFVIQWIKRASWSDATKELLAWVVCGVGAVAATWVTGDLLGLIQSWGSLSAAQIVAYLAVIRAGAQGLFILYWKPRQTV
ncbi:MAG: hypothetical protein M1325_01435 [Actinobacteria bacterium]|nr:hypothetical protein [Actinomycetota bacterium]